MTADYSHLQAFHATEETLGEYVFHNIPGKPSIWLAPALESNGPFRSASIREQMARAEAASKKPAKIMIDADDLEDDRETDRRMIAYYCAKKWGVAPMDAHGDRPEFSPQNCYDFFKALPIWMFDPLRRWVANPLNFVDTTQVTDEQARVMGNESSIVSSGSD